MLFTVSYYTSRKSDNNAFFIGDKKSPWYVVAIAMIGTSISGVTFLSVPGWVNITQFAYLQMVLGFVTGYLIIAYILLPLYYKMNLLSIYGYLEKRFGINSYRSGSAYFLISKLLGCAVRMYLTAIVLQIVLFDKMGVSFTSNVAITMFIVWLYTFRGGVKTLVWTDMLQTLSLIAAVLFSIYYVCRHIDLDLFTLYSEIKDSDYSRVWFFDDSNDKRYFWKQFLAGVFTTIAMTGLDHDMMQKNLSCKSLKDARKNIITYGFMFLPVNLLFLSLGVLLYKFAETEAIQLPAKSDELYAMLATGGFLPQIVGIMFIMGLIAAAFSSAGSAITALTTSFTIDILRADKNNDDARMLKTRKYVHVINTIIMGLLIIGFRHFNNTAVIDAVYMLASFTYGPLLGLFFFGLFTKMEVRDWGVPFITIAAPILSFVIHHNSERWFNGYQIGYELLIINACITALGLLMISRGIAKENVTIE